MKTRRKAIALACALALGGAASSAHAQSGQRITGITFDWTTYRLDADGSDNWPLTWADDGVQYTSYGDGWGFCADENHSSSTKTSLGFVEIFASTYGEFLADPDGSVNDVQGPPCADKGSTFDRGGKTTSMLAIGDAIYMHYSPGGGSSALKEKMTFFSTDAMRTWNEMPAAYWDGGESGRPGLPFFFQAGQGHRDARDGFIYIGSHDIRDDTDWEVQGTEMYLARVRPADLGDIALYEWVTGFDQNRNPIWTAGLGPDDPREPVLVDSRGFMRSSAAYLPDLGRYVLVTNHTARNQGNLTIWEAPDPWGPWTPILDESGWPKDDPDAPQMLKDEVDDNQGFAFGNFSPTWGNGQNCVFVWFRPDAWNSVACRFQTDGTSDDTPPPAPQNLDATATGASEIDLTWSSVNDPESGISHYKVYRDDTVVGTPGQTSFTDTGLSPSTTYTYRVSAVNGSGLEGSLSDPASATTESGDDTSPPPAPTNPTATAAGTSRIDVNWTAVDDPESGVDHYKVYRDGSVVGTPTQANFSDSGLDPNTTYSYRISAVNGAGLEGEKSSAASATTEAAGEGPLISGLSAATGAGYLVVEDGFTEGAVQYIDRTYTLTEVPEPLSGLTFIQTANDDKNAEGSGGVLVSFDVSQDVAVYVAHDTRLAPTNWLIEDFNPTGLSIASEADTRFEVYGAVFPKGTVTLGSNTTSVIEQSAMYTIIVSTNAVVFDALPPAPPEGLRIVPSQ